MKGRQKGETGNTSLQIKCVQNWATLNFKGTNNTKLFYKENEVEERLTQTRGEIQHMAGIDMFKNSAQTSTQKWFTYGKKKDTFISWHFNGLRKEIFKNILNTLKYNINGNFIAYVYNGDLVVVVVVMSL